MQPVWTGRFRTWGYFIFMSENGQRQSTDRAMIGSNTMKSSPSSPSYCYKTMHSPVGLLTLEANDHGLAEGLWENDDPKRLRRSSLKEDTK